MKTFKTEQTEKGAMLDVVEALQDEIQTRYNWWFVETDEDGKEYEKYPENMNDYERAKLKALVKCSEVLNKLL